MHANSIVHMRSLVERYLDRQKVLTIADVGSYDFIGSYHGTDFNASKILLKCPSKYQEQKINV